MRAKLIAGVLILAGLAVSAHAGRAPQYGGELNVGTVYVTLSALSWDPSDWTWKANHDYGLVREHLFVADLTKAQAQGGPYRFVSEAYLPQDAIVGELAESWRWEDPHTLVITLRDDVYWHGKPGVMERRRLTADDVKFTFELIDASPKKSVGSYFDYISSVEVRDERTVVFNTNKFNAEWQYRFGYGYQSSIVPVELAQTDPKDWRKMVGTGPFEMTRYVQGNQHEYTRRPDYWGAMDVAGRSYQLPFVDRVKYRVIKDEATYLTALRTAKLDILESIRWINVEHLKRSTPELKWKRWLAQTGNFVALRLDHEPFKDIRVRRALNLAVNHREIVALFYGGNAELMAYPQHPEFGPYFEPLEAMPKAVQQLFDYDPEEARRLLAEAGYGDGFRFTIQACACNPTSMDLVPLLAKYLADVGVTVEVQPMEYAAFLSAMTTRTHAPGYLMNNGHTSPIATLRKFGSTHTWNPAGFKDAAYDAALVRLAETRDEAERIVLARQLNRQLLEFAPYIWLPIQYLYTAWWPWVNNYEGELRAGAVRPGPIYSRIWIDQDLKRELGF